MKNIIVDSFEAADLRKQVEKVLRGLGNPEPPLDLKAVCELLHLDRRYYSSTDDSAVREVVSRLRIAGKQILARPTLLVDVIRKAQLSALWVPDRKRILIDADTPKLKHRWYETHEIGHSLAPWHQEFLHGDNEETLTPTCREQLEAEANYTAGQLLFMMGRFTAEASDCAPDIKSVQRLARTFGNTITSTLWRFVEEVQHVVPLVGVVTPSPFSSVTPAMDGHHHARRYCIESSSFKERFGQVSEQELREIINSYVTIRRGGPLGESEVVLRDRNGNRHVFHFETFSNGHSLLTLGVYLRPVLNLVTVADAILA